ncbi:uncharacterized protein YALI1_D30395g [Yarrowia lipolytica]|uniref:Transmembrane protein n=1 Tax=Yarrowia lipolytica TaxID=4952 RepID=A0A1D8NFW1_YARLL|nr:hypothetical protein YALI1_D30395g [Yarrowia lipolytica]
MLLDHADTPYEPRRPSLDNNTQSSDMDTRIDKLTAIVEQLVSHKEQESKSFEKLLVDVLRIPSWTTQTFFTIGLFISAWAFLAANQC